MQNSHQSRNSTESNSTNNNGSSEDNTIKINRPQNLGIETEVSGGNSMVGMRVSSGLPFPFKLHDMLDNAASGGYEGIVTWAGKNGFIVHDKDSFVENIIPKYFSQTKYRSFQRLLNMWGFQRRREGPQKGAYFHEQFQQGNPSLCGSMRCEKIKKKSVSAKVAAKRHFNQIENKTIEPLSNETLAPPSSPQGPDRTVAHANLAPEAAESRNQVIPSFEDTFGDVKQIISVGRSRSNGRASRSNTSGRRNRGIRSEPLPTYSDLFDDREFHAVSKLDRIDRIKGVGYK